MKATNWSEASSIVHLHYSFIYLGHALFAKLFYYFLTLSVCDFNAAKIFILEPKDDPSLPTGLGHISDMAFGRLLFKVLHEKLKSTTK
jgi:hypothetical protein